MTTRAFLRLPSGAMAEVATVIDYPEPGIVRVVLADGDADVTAHHTDALIVTCTRE